MKPAAVKALLDGDIENLIVASSEGGIEAQEARGQRDFVANQTLPKECPREDLEKMGFVFGDDADDIFINVQFPKGWEKKPTEHSMWNDLVDSKGRKRGGIFYKAAFYDRSSHMYLSPRFSVRQDYDLKDELQHNVYDGEEPIYKTELTECKTYSDGYFDKKDKQEKEAMEWLDKKYPDWKKKTAYWN